MAGTPVCTIDETGIHVPSFQDCYDYFADGMRGIYGSDLVLTPDTQDGQWVGVQAAALNDANAAAAAAYNAFSPSTAQGAGLSSIVKTNGIARGVPTYSTADLFIVGQAGAIILNGIASDSTQNRWALPVAVTIPPTGQITVTATCTTIGAIAATPGDISTIATPTLGWQSVTNPGPAAPGAPVESDAALRARQAISTALPSRSLLEGLQGAVASLQGVIRVRTYENDRSVYDVNSIPPHSVSLVVEGGDADAIASLIFAKKGPGVGTYGSVIQTVFDAYGIPHLIGFWRPVEPPISWQLDIRVFAGFNTAIRDRIAQSLADWTNTLGIGRDVLRTRAFVPANLAGGAGSGTYEIVSLRVGRDAYAPTENDVPMAFYEAAAGDPVRVTFTVVA